MIDEFKRPWIVADYLDIGKYGVLDNDGRIVIGISSGIEQARLQYIVDAVNSAEKK